MSQSKSNKPNKQTEEIDAVPEVVEVKQHSQKVKILVSVFRIGTKIISALGIPTTNSIVEHIIPKNKLKDDEIFNIISVLSTDPHYVNNKTWAPVVQRTLEARFEDIRFPPTLAKEFDGKPIGKLIHDTLNIEIELFVK